MRSRLHPIVVVTLLLVAIIGHAPSSYGQTFRVMSFNLLEGGRDQLDMIFQIIKDNGADIVLIQESNTLNTTFEQKAIANGFYVVQNNIVNSVLEPAIISKFKIVEFKIVHRSVQAIVELPTGVKIKVHSAHFPPLELNQERTFLMKQNVDEYLRSDRERYPVIFGGDLNLWSYQTDILGQLSSAGFKQDVFDRLDYIYSHGLSDVSGTSKVIGGGANWPSDHNAVLVTYLMPTSFAEHTRSFSITNGYKKKVLLKSSDFLANFPMGNLTGIQIVKSPTRGKISFPDATIGSNAVIPLKDIDNVTYTNELIGLDEIEWLGITTSGNARHSSFVRIENGAAVSGFDRSKCLFDTDLLNSGSRLYFGSADQFVSASLDSLKGAEFVKFPTYIAHFNNPSMEEYFSIDVMRPSTIYIAYDDRHIMAPSWLTKNFTLTNITFASTEDSYTVYKKKVAAGTFRFGSNNYMNWPQRAFVDQFVMIILPEKIVVGLVDQKMEAQISVSPNPAQHQIKIDLGILRDEVLIEIMDMTGRAVLTHHGNLIQSFETELPGVPGMYLMKVNADRQQQFFKIVKQP